MTFEEILEEESTLNEHPANFYKRHWSTDTGLWEYEHRKKLGLSSKDKLVVHHKDGNYLNNNKKNLVALTRSQHCAVEKPALKHEKCKICGAKHFGKGYCAHHYWLLVTKKKA